ncbi:hypothetical protein SCALM49S_03966 [Streptomyces californicus]
MTAMAIFDVQCPLAQLVGSRPKRPVTQLSSPPSARKTRAKTSAAEATEVAYGVRMTVRQNVLARSR